MISGIKLKIAHSLHEYFCFRRFFLNQLVELRTAGFDNIAKRFDGKHNPF